MSCCFASNNFEDLRLVLHGVTVVVLLFKFRSPQRGLLYTRWPHQMETFSALLAICAGNSPVTGDFPAQRPVTRSFDVFFDLRLNIQLSKQWWDVYQRCWNSKNSDTSLILYHFFRHGLNVYLTVTHCLNRCIIHVLHTSSYNCQIFYNYMNAYCVYFFSSIAFTNNAMLFFNPFHDSKYFFTLHNRWSTS